MKEIREFELEKEAKQFATKVSTNWPVVFNPETKTYWVCYEYFEVTK